MRNSLDSYPALCYNAFLVSEKIDILATARHAVGDEFRVEPARSDILFAIYSPIREDRAFFCLLPVDLTIRSGIVPCLT